MKILRFHEELYSAEALDRAVAVFEGHASVERKQEKPYAIAVLSARASESEDRLAGEFANWVLALTAEQRLAGGQAPPGRR